MHIKGQKVREGTTLAFSNDQFYKSKTCLVCIETEIKETALQEKKKIHKLHINIMSITHSSPCPIDNFVNVILINSNKKILIAWRCATFWETKGCSQNGRKLFVLHYICQLKMSLQLHVQCTHVYASHLNEQLRSQREVFLCNRWSCMLLEGLVCYLVFKFNLHFLPSDINFTLYKMF